MVAQKLGAEHEKGGVCLKVNSQFLGSKDMTLCRLRGQRGQ